MSLPKSTVQRESEKFVEDASGDVTVRTTTSASALPSGASTEAKQDDIIALLDSGSSDITSYQTNDIDDNGTATDILYIGLEDEDGAWCVQKFDETTSTLPTIQYATVINNGGTTTYSTAWTGRAALTYNDYSVVF